MANGNVSRNRLHRVPNWICNSLSLPMDIQQSERANIAEPGVVVFNGVAFTPSNSYTDTLSLHIKIESLTVPCSVLLVPVPIIFLPERARLLASLFVMEQSANPALIANPALREKTSVFGSVGGFECSSLSAGQMTKG